MAAVLQVSPVLGRDLHTISNTLRVLRNARTYRIKSRIETNGDGYARGLVDGLAMARSITLAFPIPEGLDGAFVHARVLEGIENLAFDACVAANITPFNHRDLADSLSVLAHEGDA
jgi:hypothetical protein